MEHLLDQVENKGGGGIAWQPQHDDAIVGFGRIVPYVRKAEVTGQETGLVILGVTRDDRVFGIPQADVRTSIASWPNFSSSVLVERGRSASTRKRTEEINPWGADGGFPAQLILRHT